MRILVVEDQDKVAQFIKQGLKEIGYHVETSATIKDAQEKFQNNDYALIIVDMMLPDGHGIDFVKTLRVQNFLNPILILTALSTTKDKVAGLDSGADDYLTKPFSFDELIARIRALLRRNQPGSSGTNILKYADLELDIVHRKALRQGKEISLTSKEFSLLEYFMRNPERPVGRMQIADHVWDVQFDSESNVIDVYINLLRKKIDLPFETKLIHTVVGTGYVLKLN